MNKEFVTYEQALALKELGFDEPCFGVYSEYDKTRVYDESAIREGLKIQTPLYQQAFRWFRDKKLTDAGINRHGTHDGGYSYRWDIVHEYGVYEERHFKLGYKTYEEAEDACINEIIELLKG